MEDAFFDAEGSCALSLETLIAEGRIARRGEGHSWGLRHGMTTALACFREEGVEIRLGLARNPVLDGRGRVVLEATFPRVQATFLPALRAPQTPEEAREALLDAHARTYGNRADEALALLLAGAILTLGPLGVQGATFAVPLSGGDAWAVETPDGQRHPILRGASDLGAPANALRRASPAPLAAQNLPRSGARVETTAHQRMEAAETVLSSTNFAFTAVVMAVSSI